jgi:Tfp pilus assembly protein PilV
MRFRLQARRAASLRETQGFTLVEMLLAAFVIVVGVLGLVGAFDSSRTLTLLSERRTAMAHRAQLEIERLQTYPYSELAMISKPAHSGETSNPDYYVNYNSPLKCSSEPCYAWDRETTGAEESLVIAAKEKVDCTEKPEEGCGLASANPAGRECSASIGACEWSDGLVRGKVYDFITWHKDGHCGTECPSEANYKRLTVVVTVKVPSGNHEPSPLRVSTLVAKQG